MTNFAYTIFDKTHQYKPADGNNAIIGGAQWIRSFPPNRKSRRPRISSDGPLLNDVTLQVNKRLKKKKKSEKM